MMSMIYLKKECYLDNMRNNIISYSFFSPKVLHKHRFWDKYNTWDRYWYNIPALMAVNTILYPDMDILIQYSSDIKHNDKFILLESLSKEFPNIHIEENSSQYRDCEPTVWRYRPIFDKTHNLVLCRDIDSLPTKNEFLSTLFFLKSPQYLVHTMRTHTNHTSTGTIILAGLCGFRPLGIPFLKSTNFDRYYEKISSQGWGLDQNSLINLFTNDQTWTSTNFLDSRLSSSKHIVRKPLISCVSHDELFLTNIRYDQKLDVILDLLDTFTSWSGEPIDLRKDLLEKLLSLDFDEFRSIRKILENDILRDFYL